MPDAPPEPGAPAPSGDIPPFVVSSVVRRGGEAGIRKRITVTISPRVGVGAPTRSYRTVRETPRAEPVRNPPVQRPEDDRSGLFAELAALDRDADDAPEHRPAHDLGEATARSPRRPRPRPVPVTEPPGVGPGARPGGRPRPAPAPPSRPPRDRLQTAAARRRWALGIALLVLVLSAGIPLLVRAFGGSTHDTTPLGGASGSSTSTDAVQAPRGAAPPPDQRAPLLAWSAGALSRQAVIVADRATVAALHRAGFAAARTFSRTDANQISDVDYVVDVPGSAPSTGQAGDARVALMRRSLPLAVFGTGDVAASVREVFPDGTAAARHQHKSDLDVQREGGQELLRNHAIVADAPTRAALRAGDVDLRIENVLSDLATSETVAVSGATRDAAEAAAGQPIRTIVVATGNAQATEAILTSLTVPYRPDKIVSIAPRKFRLVWQPAIAPTSTVGN